MGQISLRLIGGRKSKCDGGRAPAESSDLGKDEPHPVAHFPSGPQFGNDLLDDRILRLDKALQIVSIDIIGRFFGMHRLLPLVKKCITYSIFRTKKAHS